jgi:hypothetical protein
VTAIGGWDLARKAGFNAKYAGGYARTENVGFERSRSVRFQAMTLSAMGRLAPRRIRQSGRCGALR